MGDKRNRKRKEGVEEARGATLQTKWVLFVDEKKKMLKEVRVEVNGWVNFKITSIFMEK